MRGTETRGRGAAVVLLGSLVATACFEPPPHVVLTVSDPDRVASGATWIAFGPELAGTMQRAAIESRAFPLTLTITAAEPGRSDLWVEASDERGRVHGRGRGEVELDRSGTSAATIELHAACGTAEDGAECVLTDRSGTGTCRQGACSAALWQLVYDGGGDDWATGIAVDSSGRAVVVGNLENLESRISGFGQNDVWIGVFEPNGETVYSQPYNELANHTDTGLGIARDSAGNTIAVGTVVHPYGRSRIWIAKYDARGSRTWMHTLDSSAGHIDAAIDVAVDGHDQIVVAGQRAQRIWISKLDADGTQRWEWSTGGDLYGYVNGVAVAADGRILAAGLMETFAYGPAAAWLAELGPDGEEIWSKTIEAPYPFSMWVEDVAVDAAGNTYVTGITDLIFAYDMGDLWVARLSGEQLVWQRQLDGPAHGMDVGAGIALTGEDRVVIAGAANLEGGDSRSGDMWVVQLDAASGERKWQWIHDGAEETNDRATAVEVDAAGRIYVCGRENALHRLPNIFDSHGGDALLVELSDQGDEMQRRTHPAQVDGNNDCYAVAAGKDGEVVVTGFETRDLVKRMIWTRQYSMHGGREWTDSYDHPDANLQNVAYGVDDTADGGFVVVGTYSDEVRGQYHWMQKYDAGQTPQWRQTSHTSELGIGIFTDVDARGAQIVATGLIFDWYLLGEASYYPLVAWYDDAGALQDHAVLAPPGVQEIYEGDVIALPDDRALLVAGTWTDASNAVGMEALVVAVSRSGEVEPWPVLPGLDTRGDDAAWSVTLDPQGNAVVAGFTTHWLKGQRAWVTRYSPGGEVLPGWPWVDEKDEARHTTARSVATGPQGEIVVGGSIGRPGSADDFWLRGLSADGAELWEISFDGGADNHDQILAVAIDQEGAVYAAGKISPSQIDGRTDIWVARFAP